MRLYKCRSHNGVKYFPMSQWNRVFILIDFKKRVNLCCFSSIASTLQRFALCSLVQLSSHMQMYVRIGRPMLFRMLIILHLNDAWFYSFEPKHTHTERQLHLNWLKTKKLHDINAFQSFEKLSWQCWHMYRLMSEVNVVAQRSIHFESKQKKTRKFMHSDFYFTCSFT